MEIKFNTGRSYTAEGQVIRAKVCADGSIIFADDSRGVDGRIAAPAFPLTSEGALRDFIMQAYDRNQTTRDHETWEYLMRPRQPDALNQGGATPGASAVLLDDQDADCVEAFERSGPRSRHEEEAAADAWDEMIATIAVVAFMQALWEDANGRRRDEEGKRSRTRRDGMPQSIWSR